MGNKHQQLKLHQSFIFNPKWHRSFALGLFSFLMAYLVASILTPVKQSDATQLVDITNEKTGYYEPLIINISNKTDTVDFDEPLIESIKGDMLKDARSQTIKGVVVYSTYRLYGTCVREPIYSAYVENSHMNKIVFISSSDGNETAKMISTIKFN